MTVFIVHGWTGDENTDWMFDIKDALLQQVEFAHFTIPILVLLLLLRLLLLLLYNRKPTIR